MEVAIETKVLNAKLANAANDHLLPGLEDVRALSILRSGCTEASQKVGRTDRSLDGDDVTCLDANGNIVHELNGARDELGATDRSQCQRIILVNHLWVDVMRPREQQHARNGEVSE